MRLHLNFFAVVAAGVATAMSLSPPQARAQSPGSPVRLVIPYPAGTTIDVVGRVLAEGLSREVGRPVIVDNRPGAAGALAVEYVAGAASDGNTALLAVNSQLTINPLTQPSQKLDPLRALSPVAMVVEGSYLMVANPAAGYADLASLITAAKANPGAINYASYGVGSMPHLCAEQFQAMTQVRLNHVPYKGSPTNDLVGGNIEVGFEAPNVMPFIKSGKLVGLGVTSQGRLADLPGTPPLADRIPGYECVGLVGLLVPANTPAATRSALELATLRVAGAPEFSARLAPHGLTLRLGGAEPYAAFLRGDQAKWSKLVKDLNLKLN